MLWLYRFFNGYLLLEFSGEFSERILNLCAKKHITLWGLHCRKRKITGCISVGDFRRLRYIRRGKRIKVHILEKRGLPFFIKKYRKRTAFFAGIILFFLILNYLSGFIWTVRVSGNRNISDEEIIKACREIGIYEGMRKRGFDAKAEKERLLINSDSLAWSSMNIEGCVMTVNVTEIKNRKNETDGVPTNLKATGDGIIKKLDIKSGNCVVKLGDTVKQGDVLVSGIIEGQNSTQFVHSSGAVIAKTEREIKARADFNQTVCKKTGRKSSKSVLSFFHLKIPLYLGRTSSMAKTETEIHNAQLFGQKLPMSIISKKFYFTKNVKRTFSREELETQLIADIKSQISDCGIEDYEIKEKKITEDAKGLEMTVIISAEENIAFQDILLFYSGN